MNDSTTPPQLHHNDEIDLKDLLKKTIRALERGTITIILSVLLGAILGLAYFFYSSTTYSSSMVISSDILVLSNIQALFDPFEDLIGDKDSTTIADRLNINKEDAAKIKKFEVEAIFGSENTGNCEIIVTVTDISVLPQLEEGILNFLENNKFVKRRVALREEKYNALLEKIDNDIKGIDSLKTKVQGSNLFGASTMGSNVLMMEPANLFRVSLEMAERRQDLLGQLALNDSIELFRGFTPSSKPSSPSWILCLVGGLVGGLIIGFTILFFKEIDRYVRS